MLTIKNIDKIVGLLANGREIVEAGDYVDSLRKNGKDYFVFKIARVKDGIDYNKEHDIVLTKETNENGKYCMFNMGLQIRTEIELHKDNLISATELAHSIRNVLVKTQTYYQTN